MHAYIHRIDILARQQVMIVGGHIWHIVLARHPLHLILADIAYCHDFRFRDFGVTLKMLFCDLASANDANADLTVFHTGLLLLSGEMY